LSILELTRLLIVDNPIWSIPDMNRLLVEGATHPERKTALHLAHGAAWERYDTDVIGSEIADALHATGALIDRKKPFEEQLFPREQEERIRTRLGAEGARIVFAEPHPQGPFGEPVSEVVLPAHWTRGLALDDGPVTPMRADGNLIFVVGDVAFTYDRFGLQRERGLPDELADGRTVRG
jgi:CRISPR-associated endonuclease/helicase Cas3